MYQKLLNHNADLRQLRDKGYAVDFAPGYLIVRDIPYLDNMGHVQTGTIAATLIYTNGTDIVTQQDHQIYFSGSIPYGLDGNVISNINPRQSPSINLGSKYQHLKAWWLFSNKPVSGHYKNFFEKIETYVSLISGPAIYKKPEAKYLTFAPPINKQDDFTENAFVYADVLSSRAEIGDISSKLKDEVIAIIGLGGTGGYIMDFMAKTPVKEIRLFDFDTFELHNSYRSPGKLDLNELGKYKVDVYESRYNNVKKGITKYETPVTESCSEKLNGVTFAFVSVDSGKARAEIISLLVSKKIPFIDTGIGITRTHSNYLRGAIRTTYFSTDTKEIEKNIQQVPKDDADNDMYKTNIQIAELNALNACIAVLRYKQLKGFYMHENKDLLNTNINFDITDIRIFGDTIED